MNAPAVLNKPGHRMCTATARQQALDVLRREDGIKFVIIDHVPPNMTGMELAEAIRMDWLTMPIIFATPLAGPSVQQVSKPFRDEELLNVTALITPAEMRTVR
jgi:DNA-binding response OmpR family regulator